MVRGLTELTRYCLISIICEVALTVPSPNLVSPPSSETQLHRIRNSFNESALSAGEMQRYVVYPKKTGKPIIDLVRDRLALYIRTGTYKTIPSKHRPEFDGILVWKVTTDEEEVEALQRSLGSDVTCRRFEKNGKV